MTLLQHGLQVADRCELGDDDEALFVIVARRNYGAEELIRGRGGGMGWSAVCKARLSMSTARYKAHIYGIHVNSNARSPAGRPT